MRQSLPVAAFSMRFNTTARRAAWARRRSRAHMRVLLNVIKWPWDSTVGAALTLTIAFLGIMGLAGIAAQQIDQTHTAACLVASSTAFPWCVRLIFEIRKAWMAAVDKEEQKL